MEDRIAALRGADGVRAIVIDAAVLFEAGWNTLCDTTVFVEAPEPVRLDRVRRSRGWSEADFHQREAEQFPLDRKRRLCCYSVQNVSDVSHLPGQVTRVLDEILA
jgi:dephospho-CoA kinase